MVLVLILTVLVLNIIRDQPFMCLVDNVQINNTSDDVSPGNNTSSEEVTLLTLCILHEEHTNGRCAYGTASALYQTTVVP